MPIVPFNLFCVQEVFELFALKSSEITILFEPKSDYSHMPTFCSELQIENSSGIVFHVSSQVCQEFAKGFKKF